MKASSPQRAALLIAFLFSFAAASVPAAQAQGLGVLAGTNYDDLSDIEDEGTDLSFDRNTGYHVGVFYDLTLGPVALRPAVVYVDAGSFDFDTDDFDVRLIEVPVDARFRFTAPFVKPYVLAGPVFRFNASNNDGDFEDAFNDVSVAAGVGLGIQLSIPGTSVALYPEARYQFGLSRFTDENVEIDGVSLSDDPQLNAFMLRVGIAL